MAAVYQRGGMNRPVFSTAVADDLRKALSRVKIQEDADLYGVAESAIKLQIQKWKDSEANLGRTKPDLNQGLKNAFGIDFRSLKFKGVFGENPVDDVDVIAAAAEKDIRLEAWDFDGLPYTIRCVGLARAQVSSPPRKKKKTEGPAPSSADVDEWVLRNEIRLRDEGRSSANNFVSSKDDWSRGLIKIDHFPVVFPHLTIVPVDGTAVALKVTRPAISQLPGFTVLHAKCSPVAYVQPSIQGFTARFDSMTSGILAGLDWSNVFIAGGVVLGALLTPDVPTSHADHLGVKKTSEWQSSDIDLYIYGLDPVSANVKIKHIAEIYRKNSPKDAPFLAVRNSQTITFYSKWPLRRVQIVMKLIGSPREVLLNFDLDICALGFDGKEVWMLPRCARALETGTNVFTMDLINGHYLGDRKATRDKRVFKYANKGYGIRILPSYAVWLSNFKNPGDLKAIALGERLLAPPLQLELIAAEGRKWTRKTIKSYLALGHKNRPFHWPEMHPPVPSTSGKPVFSHAMLESYAQVTSEPLGRSCLTGFMLFMRHVGLWEEDVAGNIEIYEPLWATDVYGEGPLQQVFYDDTPTYGWDKNFKIKGLTDAIDEYNKKEFDNAKENTRGWQYGDSTKLQPLKAENVARVTYADSVDEILSSKKDIVIPLILKPSFMDFANDLIVKALADAGSKVDVIESKNPLVLVDLEPEGERLALWRLNRTLNWQMLDRRIDEVREVLWAFHRANERMAVESEARLKMLLTNISRRAIRTSEQAEMAAFVRWVGRKPYHHGRQSKINALWALGDESMDEEDEDEDEEGQIGEDDEDE